MPKKILMLVFISSTFGCVSSGKFKELHAEKVTLEKAWEEDKVKLDTENQNLKSRLSEINLDQTRQNTLLAELLNDKIELEKEVLSQMERIANLSSESKSLEAGLNEELERKNENLKLKEARLNRMINWLLQQEANLNKISAQLGEVMTGYAEDEIDWFFQDYRLDIILYQDFMFSNTRSLSSGGTAALLKLADLLTELPSLDIIVEGHTDNSMAQINESLISSTQRAVAVGTHLVEEGGINGNQLTVCGRGSYYPRVSNQTPAGRAMNNRVEISLRPPYHQLLTFLEE